MDEVSSEDSDFQRLNRIRMLLQNQMNPDSHRPQQLPLQRKSLLSMNLRKSNISARVTCVRDIGGSRTFLFRRFRLNGRFNRIITFDTL
jgi:hypothetical protein